MLRRTKKKRTSQFRPDGLPEDRLKFRSRSLPQDRLTTFEFYGFYPMSAARLGDALDQINTWREHNRLLPLADKELKICQEEVSAAVRSVQYLKEWAPFTGTTKSYRRIVKAQAKTLRKVTTFRGISGELLHLAKEEAQKLEWLATVEQPRIGTAARKQAVSSAKRLLTRFGGKPPGQTAESPWHELSRILFGERDADMFETMRQF